MAAYFAYSQDQGMRVYDGGPLRGIANNLEQFHKLQRGVGCSCDAGRGGD